MTVPNITSVLGGLIDTATGLPATIDLGVTTGGIDVVVSQFGLVFTRHDGTRVDLANHPSEFNTNDPQTLRGTTSADSLNADGGPDYVYGGPGSDLIAGGSGNDHLYGGSATTGPDAADTISGGNGADYVQGNAGNDLIDGGDGNDRIQGGADNDTVIGGAGDDLINGNFGDDLVNGGTGNDIVRGGKGNDRIFGGDGADQIHGDLGADTMTGGAGADVFHFAGSDAGVVDVHDLMGSIDTITDFGGGDKISLGFMPAQVSHGSSALGAVGALAYANALFGSLQDGGHDAVAVQVGSDTLLFYSSVGGHAVDSVIDLTGIQAADVTTSAFV